MCVANVTFRCSLITVRHGSADTVVKATNDFNGKCYFLGSIIYDSCTRFIPALVSDETWSTMCFCHVKERSQVK